MKTWKKCLQKMLIIGKKLLFQYWQIQIFSFMEEKCSSVCSYDKNIVTFWQKRTFTLKVNVLSAWCLHGFQHVLYYLWTVQFWSRSSLASNQCFNFSWTHADQFVDNKWQLTVPKPFYISWTETHHIKNWTEKLTQPIQPNSLNYGWIGCAS